MRRLALLLLLAPSTAFAQWNPWAPQPAPTTQPEPVLPQPSAPPAPNTTTNLLNRSEKEDSGRGFELFYAHLDGNFSYASLAAFSGQNKSGLSTHSAIGGAYGVSAGVRVLLFTFGLRGRLHTLTNYNLWQANAVVGFHIPIDMLDLYGEVYGGYSVANSFSEDSVAATVRAAAVREGIAALGGNAGIGIGADYYLNKYFSLGGGVNAESLFLTRGKLSAQPGDDAGVSGHPLFAGAAGMVGLGVTAGVRIGLHLGL